MVSNILERIYSATKVLSEVGGAIAFLLLLYKVVVMLLPGLDIVLGMPIPEPSWKAIVFLGVVAFCLIGTCMWVGYTTGMPAIRLEVKPEIRWKIIVPVLGLAFFVIGARMLVGYLNDKQAAQVASQSSPQVVPQVRRPANPLVSTPSNPPEKKPTARRIAEEDEAKLIKALSSSKMSSEPFVVLYGYSYESEANADDLKRIRQTSGWFPMNRLFGSSLLFVERTASAPSEGIRIAVRHPDLPPWSARTLADIFKNNGIKCEFYEDRSLFGNSSEYPPSLSLETAPLSFESFAVVVGDRIYGERPD